MYQYDVNVLEIVLLYFGANWEKKEMNELYRKYDCGFWCEIYGWCDEEGVRE